MLQRWTFGQGLFVLLAVAFLVTGFWGVSQSKMLLSEKQMREVEGGTVTVSLVDLDNSWRPMGTPTNNTVDIGVNLTSPPSKGKVLFTLNPSSYLGYCMNKGYQSDVDLKFTSTQTPATGISWGNVSGSGTSVEASFGSSPPSTLNFTVRVQAYDWGAHGYLVAGLYDEWGYPRAIDLNTVPRDDNFNKISDGWKNDDGSGYSATADDEEGPGNNTYDGDGFTVFEEYRGFEILGGWTDRDPEKKDLFVVEQYETPYDNIGAITNLPNPPFAPQMLWANETNEGGLWQVNHRPLGQGSNQSDHYAVRIVENTTYPAPDRRLGQCPQTTLHTQSPLIEVFTREIEEQYPGQEAYVKSVVMGHECGHAVDTDHCQKYGNPGGNCIMNNGYIGIPYFNGHHELHYRLR